MLKFTKFCFTDGFEIVLLFPVPDVVFRYDFICSIFLIVYFEIYGVAVQLFFD